MMNQDNEPTRLESPLSSQHKTENSYKITEIEAGGNHVSVSITVNEHGGFRIYDLSYGPMADQFYGEGRDIEHWLDLDASSVRKLMTEVVGHATPDAANDLAKLLVVAHQGQHQALGSIKEFCDEKGIQYQEERWPW